MKIISLFLLLFPCLTFGQKKAIKLAHEFIIADGHVDLPYRLKIQNFRLSKAYTGIPIATEDGDFDYVRAKKGGLDAPFMSIYIPSKLSPDEGKLLADSLISMVEFISKEKPDYFEVATSPADVKRISKLGKIALPMGMENGSPITTLQDAAYFRKRGISYVTLTHALANHICDSSYDTTRLWQGLSPFGEKLVPELARQGIMIDISHVSDSTFYDVVKISPVPVLASHSSLRHFTPGFERNMNDDMLKVLKANDGVIMINFGSSFLDASINAKRDATKAELRKLLDEKGLKSEDDAAKSIIKAYGIAHPELYSDVQKVADHIERAVALAGIDHVGLGSDFDGVGDSLPTGLKDVADYPNLIAVLLHRGYSPKDIRKICSDNVFRVWQATLDYASKL